MTTIPDPIERLNGMRAAIEAAQAQKRPQAEIESRQNASRSLQDALERAGAPKRHRDKAPDRSTPWGAKLGYVAGLAGKGYIAGITGLHGGGKTQMGVELMKDYLTAGKTAQFRTAREFVLILKDTFGKPDRSELSVLKAHMAPDLLVIDEIGKKGDSDWETGAFFELLNRRYMDMKDTFLTANLTADEFSASLGPSLMSRMNEDAGLIVVNWQSFR